LVREGLEKRGFASVASEGYKSPGVIVSYTEDPAMVAHFLKKGIQIAAGVPFKIDEPEGLKTFRVGLFGLDKLQNVQETVKFFFDNLDDLKASL